MTWCSGPAGRGTWVAAALLAGAVLAGPSFADAAYLYRKPLHGPARIGDSTDRPVAWAPTTSLGATAQHAAFSRALEAATDPDGDPIVYSAVGALPAGLSFDGATRTVSGTPTAAGTHSFMLRASAGGTQADQTFTLTVTPATGWLGAGTAADPWRLASGAQPSCAGYRSQAANPAGQPWSTAVGAGQDGVYQITPGAGAVAVYCDQTRSGGGWQLVMKTQAQDYANPIWTGTSDLNLAECLQGASGNGCKNQTLYGLASWSMMLADNKTDGYSATIAKNAARTSLQDHLTGAALNDANVLGFLNALYTPANPGPATEAVGWNRTGSPTGGRGLQRMVADHHGQYGAAIGGYSYNCGYAATTGNWLCGVGGAKTIWLWIR